MRRSCNRKIYLISPGALMLILLLLSISCNKEEYVSFHNPLEHPEEGPPAGNPDADYPVPMEARVTAI